MDLLFAFRRYNALEVFVFLLAACFSIGLLAR